MILGKKIVLLPIFYSAITIFQKSNRSLKVCNNILGLEVIDITDTLETNVSVDTILNSENKIKDIIIDNEIVDIIEHCKPKDLNNPVQILKYMHTRLVQGRHLEIKDVTQCISGARNFIMADLSNLINTARRSSAYI